MFRHGTIKEKLNPIINAIPLPYSETDGEWSPPRPFPQRSASFTEQKGG